ncbi:MAG: nuclease-related domain-containing protein [Candidatus Electronema sp. VV]
MSIANIFKGWIGEKAVQFGMWMKLDGNIYKKFHNIIIQTADGTTQIDHVLLSVYGIFVIETKNYKGWIYGGATQKQWTQVLFGKKSQFKNPLHQNYKHTKALSEYLRVDHKKIHSVVIFIGEDVQLKTEFPPNVLTGGMSSYVKSFAEIIFSEDEINLFEDQLKNVKENQNILSNYNHIKSVKSRFKN